MSEGRIHNILEEACTAGAGERTAEHTKSEAVTSGRGICPAPAAAGERHISECHISECHISECHIPERHISECHISECHISERHIPEHHIPERIRSSAAVDSRSIPQDSVTDRRVRSYIALDTETTGLNPKQDRIMEIGAVRVLDGAETEFFQTLVNPRRLLELRVSELTGITDGMLVQAPDMDEVLERFLDFCGELPVLGHNILFDFSFLKRAAVNRQREFERQGVDTLSLCRHFMPKEARKSLDAACAFYGITREGSHRALGDARDAHRLYQRLLALYGESEPEAFAGRNLIYKVKREQPASEKQKEGLRDLLKYHKIDLPLQIDSLSRSEISRIRDKIISQYGRIGSN